MTAAMTDAVIQKAYAGDYSKRYNITLSGEIDSQTTIGYKRILRFDNVTSNKLRFNILAAKGSPTISNIEITENSKVFIFRNDGKVFNISALDSSIENGRLEKQFFIEPQKTKSPLISAFLERTPG